MNRASIEDSWHLLKGRVLEQWGRLTDDDLDVVEGRHEQLSARMRQRREVLRSGGQALDRLESSGFLS